jgi:peroxiredoxin
MSDTPKRGEPLSVVQTLLVLVAATAAVGVGYFEFKAVGVGYFKFQVETPSRPLSFVLLDEAIAIEPLLKGLMRAVPLVLLAATFCTTYAALQNTRHERRRAIRAACGLLLAGVAGIAAHQFLLYRVFIPSIDRGRLEHAQWVGTRTSLGELAPDMSVTTVDGETLRMADLRGSVVVLSFFATDSPPCESQLAELQKIWNRFHVHDELRLLAIGRGESIESIQKFAAEHGFTFPLAADANRAAFGSFATEGVPRVYLISRDGKIVFQCQGYHEEKMAALTSLLQAELARRE